MMNRLSIVSLALASLVCAPRASAAQAAAFDPAVAAIIQAAVVERLGENVEVEVLALDVPSAADGVEVVEARLDPVARLGKPMRVTLVTDTRLQVRVTATLRVIADHVVARAAVHRAQTLSAENVEAVRGELNGVPLRPLPVLAQVLGGNALRPIAAGAVIEPNFVKLPRVVEPGDVVVVIAAIGAVQVTARLTAVDGGQVGDVIRVSNKETRTYVRARILERGLAEVIHGR